MSAPRFQVLVADLSGVRWIIAASDDPAEAFAELESLSQNTRGPYCCVWDDQQDRALVDLEEAVDVLEDERQEAEEEK